MRILVLFPFLLVLAGCGGNAHETAAAESIDLMNEIADLLETCTDKASAEKARPKLRELGERMKALGERTRSLGAPSEAESKRLAEKYAQQTSAAVSRMVRAMMKVGGDEEIGAVLSDEMADIRPGR